PLRSGRGGAVRLAADWEDLQGRLAEDLRPVSIALAGQLLHRELEGVAVPLADADRRIVAAPHEMVRAERVAKLVEQRRDRPHERERMGHRHRPLRELAEAGDLDVDV